MQSMRRLDGARFVKAFLQLRLWKTWEAKARCNQFARPDGVVGAAGDELRLRGLAGSEHRLKGETRSGVEGPELAFVIELAPAPAPGLTAKNATSPRSARAERKSRLRARMVLRRLTNTVSTCMPAKSRSFA